MSEEMEREPGFGDALAELERTLQRIEGEEIDIDRLAEELKKAAGLLEICRSKIRRAETEVSQIVQKLEREEAAPDDGADAEETDGEEGDEGEGGGSPAQDGLF